MIRTKPYYFQHHFPLFIDCKSKAFEGLRKWPNQSKDQGFLTTGSPRLNVPDSGQYILFCAFKPRR